MATSQPKALELNLLKVGFLELEKETLANLFALHSPGMEPPIYEELWTDKYPRKRYPPGEPREQELLGYRYQLNHPKFKITVTDCMKRRISLKKTELFAHFDPADSIVALLTIVDGSQLFSTFERGDYFDHLNYYHKLFPGLPHLFFFIRADVNGDLGSKFITNLHGYDRLFDDQYVFLNCGGPGSPPEVPQEDRHHFVFLSDIFSLLYPVPVSFLKSTYYPQPVQPPPRPPTPPPPVQQEEEAPIFPLATFTYQDVIYGMELFLKFVVAGYLIKRAYHYYERRFFG